jgi:excisionase family DNA binding protein
MERLLTAREAADLLRVSRTTLYRLLKDQQLPAVRMQKDLRFRASDLEVWLNSKREVAAR